MEKKNKLEILDAELLKYIHRKKGRALRKKVLKKFGEVRATRIERKGHIFESGEMVEVESGYPPPNDKKPKFVEPRKYAISDDAAIMVEDYKAVEKVEWRKHWIPVIISFFALAVSIIAIAVTIKQMI